MSKKTDRQAIERAVFHLRQYAGYRQSRAHDYQWSAEMQALVDLAIKLENISKRLTGK
jgi:hypothetical protein